MNRFPVAECAPLVSVTLADQVRAEAIRRGGEWKGRADRCAALAVRWFGHRPCKGEDLRTVFDEIFRTDGT
ncbi:hypothetical protein HDG34_002517 [Paraburkholderia sp. HC6.4b]|nr:hypothetical protein [Paraburkholderia sp. HC6.4b]MBB5450412.1 hypothetical protein [Paraburkholderia sp. Kb1A]